MTNNTPEWWSIDGVSLHQYGWSVTTFGGARYDLPPRRGENVTLAYKPGQVFRPKQPDQRVITLTMFLVGMDPATGRRPANNDQRLQFNDSWDFLRRLVWKSNGRQVGLVRRWLLTSETHSLPNQQSSLPGLLPPGKQLVAASAYAEMSGTMTPTMTGRTRADFSMDFTLADPFFYGAQVEVRVDNGGSLTVYNAGNDTASSRYLEVEFHGPLTNPILRNLDTDPDLWLKIAGSTGTAIKLDIGQFTAVDLANASNNRIGQVSHKGARHWFGLQPGLNKLTLVDDGNHGGHAIVRWRPPYV